MEKTNEILLTESPLGLELSATLPTNGSERVETDLLLMGLTHDMRSPLFAMLGYLHLLEKRLEAQNSAKNLEYVQLAQQAGQRLDQMVTETLDLVRFGHKLPALQKERVSLKTLFQKLWGTFQIVAVQKQIHLNVVLKDNNDLFIHADPSFLERALDNLIANAIKFSPVGGDVVLTGSQKGGRVLFEVTDRGCGIPKEEQPAIFEPYRQVHTHDRSGGFGLGLAIVRFIARAHGGDIHVASEIGSGSCFTLWIPEVRS